MVLKLFFFSHKMSGDGQETSASIVWSRSNVLPDNDKLFVTLVFYGCCWG